MSDTIAVAGRTFFAAGLIGLGVEHFIFQEFVTGRAPPWPEGVPGGTVWAYVTGVAFIVLGLSFLSGRGVRPAAMVTAALIFTWAFVRLIPVAAADSVLGGTWTMAGKALTFTGGALAIAGTRPAGADRGTRLSRFMNLRRELIVFGAICLGLFMVMTGIQHFIFTEFVASLIPAWFPGNAVFWTYFAAVALIAGGIGLNVPPTARLAAYLSGWMIFSWFWIVHLPRTLASASDGMAVFEALAFSGIAFVLATSERIERSARDPVRDPDPDLARVDRGAVAGGIRD